MKKIYALSYSAYRNGQTITCVGAARGDHSRAKAVITGISIAKTDLRPADGWVLHQCAAMKIPRKWLRKSAKKRIRALKAEVSDLRQQLDALLDALSVERVA